MTRTCDLDELMRRAAADGREEGEFLRALLLATLYTLAPLSDDHPRLRLIMFKRPEDGLEFVPLFTDELMAIAAAQMQLRVVSGAGRDLLEATKGAAVVINPNDQHCTLYPEEIEALLSSGHVAHIDQETITTERQVLIGEPRSPPAWLIQQLRALYLTLPFVDEARLVYVAPPNAPTQGLLTLVIIAKAADADRAARATITATQERCRTMNMPLDITVEATDGGQPFWAGRGLQIYAKGKSER